jgi:hypothetical protein
MEKPSVVESQKIEAGKSGGSGCAIPSEIITDAWSKPHTEIKRWCNDDVLKHILDGTKKHDGYDPKKDDGCHKKEHHGYDPNKVRPTDDEMITFSNPYHC